MTSSSILFYVAMFVLSNLVTGWSFMSISALDFGFMTTFGYKVLSRNPEIGNTLAWVLSNI